MLADLCAVIVGLPEVDAAQAERGARAELVPGLTVPKLLAETVVCELAVRRGDPDAPDRLADLVEQADHTGELQRILPALELETEWALTQGSPLPVERFKPVVDEIARTRDGMPGWSALRVTAWASVAGLRLPWDGSGSAPHAAMLRRDWAAAAEALR